MPKNNSSLIIEEKNEIIDLMDSLSKTMRDYIIAHENSTFICYHKELTHSDIITAGKIVEYNDKDDVNHLKDNLLTYFSVEEMREQAKKIGKRLPTAHQSNINLANSFFEKINEKPHSKNRKQYLLSDKMEVFLVNDSLEFFQPKYTKEIFKRLNKDPQDSVHKRSWDFKKLKVHLNYNELNGIEGLTSITLHVAAHGIGTKEDDIFYILRHHVFRSDSLFLVYETNNNSRRLFILFNKNQLFYQILNNSKKNKTLAYIKKLEKNKDILIQKNKQVLDASKDVIKKIEKMERKQQAAWRNLLINEMMAYSEDQEQISCPITNLLANPYIFSCLFVASHIKEYNDSGEHEKYDKNNGLLLSQTADALFNDHLITINENKELEFSCVFDGNERLIKELKLNLENEISKLLLNDDRMKYLKYHKKEFDKKELKRKKERIKKV